MEGERAAGTALFFRQEIRKIWSERELCCWEQPFYPVFPYIKPWEMVGEFLSPAVAAFLIHSSSMDGEEGHRVVPALLGITCSL